MQEFVHLHLHTTYSILDGACQTKKLVARAKALSMPACAITDHGTMFGIKDFYDACRESGIKPILGMEAYVATEPHTERNARSGDHLVLLAKNRTGYRNLTKLSSIAYTEGMYYRPRIDKQLLEQYGEGLIVSSACLAGEIPKLIADGNHAEAEKTAKWYKRVFGDDFYLEIMLHHSDSVDVPPELTSRINREVYSRQIEVNKNILELGRKLDIKVVATNDVHFLMQSDAEAHDVLLCVNTLSKYADPNRMRYTRQEWFKSGDEMALVFPDNAEQLANTLEVADKIEQFNLDSDPIMPVFPIPNEFQGNAGGNAKRAAGAQDEEEALRKEFGKNYDRLGGNGPDALEKVRRIKLEAEYLEHLTRQGAAARWPTGLSQQVEDRISFELETIKKMGFPGYFLIVQDFIAAARGMGVMVGPGRGSAAGSIVAYCLRITNINPLKYELLFERFLNPDRISMPDIDIDFDDEGRQRVLDWVVNKYGAEHVAHIVTFGSMAPKSSIRDVARALEVDLPESNRLTAFVPSAAAIKTLSDAYEHSPELRNERDSGTSTTKRILGLADDIGGSIRGSGVHACGIIISRDPLIETIPVMATANESLLTTQYEGSFVESLGLLKMDMLGLKTLTVVKNCIASVKETRGIDIDIDAIPMDDKETFGLFARGETTGLFQFESDGMKKHLRSLQPNCLEDLVAMNALYRPGPMQYIPDFVDRKHGRKKITYDHPLMESYLKSTYGVTIYQEQVMLLSRELAGFSRGQSDTLRKVMGKKKPEVLAKMKEQFVKGCLGNAKFTEPFKGDKKTAETIIEKIWHDWEAFAGYAFNKSHAVCYAYVAYQTGYLKTHYPEEYMAAQITSEIGKADKLPVFISEAVAMGYEILPPCINRSSTIFIPEKTPSGEMGIRYGLAGIKNVGFAASDSIVAERRKNGLYRSFADFLERQDSAVNKKAIESLILAGGLDSLGCHRAALIQELAGAMTRAAAARKDKEMGQTSLFEMLSEPAGGQGETDRINNSTPLMPRIEALRNEKEMLGIYMSGHPILKYSAIASKFSSVADIDAKLTELAAKLAKDPITGDAMEIRRAARAITCQVTFCAFVSDVIWKTDKQGRRWCSLVLEDTSAKISVPIFAKTLAALTTDVTNPLPQPEKERSMFFSADIGASFRGEASITITSYMPIETVPARLARRTTLVIPQKTAATANFMDKVKEVLARHPGNTLTQIMLKLDDGADVYVNLPSDYSVMPDSHFIEAAENLLGKGSVRFAME